MGSIPEARAAARSKYHNISYALLTAARANTFKKRRYNTEATRQVIMQECLKRAKLVPYAEQLDLAECMLLGLDAVSIAGTGWGKTLPFVLPLFVPEADGKMIVIISPLNALEEDQAKRFNKMGLTAIALNGQSNQADALSEIKRGLYRVIIMGPKLLVGDGGSRVRDLFSQPRFSNKILGLVVDEAHCITQWGTDFRPEYAELGSIRALLSIKAAVHATSATMPPPVLEQVCKTLLIHTSNAFVLNLGNDRPNITWEVIYMTAGKSDLECLALLLPDGDLHLRKSMVFFDDILQSMRGRRWLLDKLPEELQDRIKGYNSRRSDLGKALAMQDFQKGTVDMLFTTEAAGMGCDLPDIEHVVQFMAPESLSIWMQRAGRAGRQPDMQARATLLIQPSVFQEMGKKTRKEGEVVVYKKEIDPGLRGWVVVPEDQCRRDVADQYFENPPRRRAPTGECCDNCTRKLERAQSSQAVSSQALPAATSAMSSELHPLARTDGDEQPLPLACDRFAPENWRAFLTATRSDSNVEAAKRVLARWRQTCWSEKYSHLPFGCAALLPDPAFTTLATRTTVHSIAGLHALKWRLADRHGAEVLALLEEINHKTGLEKLQEEKEKYKEAQAAKAAKEKEKQTRDNQRAREKRDREVERELESLRKASDKRKEAEQKKQAKAAEKERVAAEKRRAAAVKAGNKAVQKIITAQRDGGPKTPRPRKRKREKVEENPSQDAKRMRIGKENVAPPMVSSGSVGGDRTAAAITVPTRPRPRPRPYIRSVELALPSPPSTPFNAHNLPSTSMHSILGSLPVHRHTGSALTLTSDYALPLSLPPPAFTPLRSLSAFAYNPHTPISPALPPASHGEASNFASGSGT